MANNKQNQNTENNPATGSTGTTGTSNFASNAPKNTAAGSHDTATSGISGTSTGESSLTGTTSGQTGSETGGATGTVKALYNKAKDSAVGQTAGEVYETAKDKAATVIDDKKHTLASGLTSVADTLRQVGDTVQTSGEQNQVSDLTAKYSDSLANQVEKLSRYLENRDLNQMMRDLESFARRNPAVFIGGAFALGFLAARFLKSSNPNQALMRRPQSNELPFGETGGSRRGLKRGNEQSSQNPGSAGATDTMNTVTQPS